MESTEKSVIGCDIYSFWGFRIPTDLNLQGCHYWLGGHIRIIGLFGDQTSVIFVFPTISKSPGVGLVEIRLTLELRDVTSSTCC